MSFNAIRNTAVSALGTAQINMQIAASNIANADTAGYSRKSGVQVMTSNGGVSAGVSVNAVASSADKYLIKSINLATTELNAAQINDSYAHRVQNLFGTVESDGSSNTLANRAAEFESALSQLSGTPESQTLQVKVIDALDTVTADLRAMSASIQELRSNADGSIADRIAGVNQKLEAIHELNTQIQLAGVRGESTGDMEDQRNIALQAIAAEMNVSAYVTSDNQMKIYTTTGTALLDANVHKIDYRPSAFVTTDTVFAGIKVGDKDITSAITSGSVGALINQRDAALPATQAEFNNLAMGLIEKLNDTYNKSTALPAPTSLTGSVTVAGADPLNGTGTFRIAEVAEDGTLLAYADFDLANFADFDAFAAAIDATTGLSASIDASGKFTIASTTGNGIAVTDVSSEIGGKGVSSALGLNDLLTGTDARSISVRADLKATPTAMANATLSKDVPLTIGSKAVAVSPATAASLYATATNANEFAAAGSLSASKNSFANYAGLISSRAAIASENAGKVLESKQGTYDTLSSAVASQSGVNVDEEVARVNELEQQYATAAQLLQILNQMFEALLGAVK